MLLLIASLLLHECRGALKVVIATVETRACQPMWHDVHTKNAIAINLFYAQKHGYEYRIYCDVTHHSVRAEWAKVAMVARLLEEAKNGIEPVFYLILDSDAYISVPDIPLLWWLETHGVFIENESWSIMMSRESTVAHKFNAPFALNSGVWYAYADPFDSARIARTIAAVDELTAAACDARCAYWRQNHAYEQSCLIKLLETSQLIRSVFNVTRSHMNYWNGPWGQFVRHLWKGPGVELRAPMIDDVVTRYLLDSKSLFRTAITQHRKPRVTFTACPGV